MVSNPRQKTRCWLVGFYCDFVIRNQGGGKDRLVRGDCLSGLWRVILSATKKKSRPVEQADFPTQLRASCTLIIVEFRGFGQGVAAVFSHGLAGRIRHGSQRCRRRRSG
jgi:hypothetical protein